MACLPCVLYLSLIVFCQTTANRIYRGPCINIRDYTGDNRELCVFLPAESVTWLSAKTLCSSYGANLIIIPGQQTNEEIHTALRQLTYQTEPWIGTQVIATQWTWGNGAELFTRVGCCSGSVTPRVSASKLITPSLCAPYCISKQYLFAHIKGDDCECSNSTCDDGSGEISCKSVCVNGWRKKCSEDQLNVSTVYKVKEDATVRWSELADVHKPCGILRVAQGIKTVGAGSCTEVMRFICQNATKDDLTISNESFNYVDARMYCHLLGADLLAQPSNDSRLDKLADGSYWVGLSRFSFTLYTGEPAQFSPLPDLSAETINSCTFISPMSLQAQWYTDKCERKRQPLCVKDTIQKIKRNQDLLPSENSEIFTAKNCSWYTAEEACEGYGGHLVIIPDEGINSFIYESMSKLTSYEPVWIGGLSMNQPWITVTGIRLYRYAGCCTANSSGLPTTVLHPNSASMCVPWCKAAGYNYAYLQIYTCLCSNETCTHLTADYCNDSCPGTDNLVEKCGNKDKDLYTAYETETNLNFPDWGTNPSHKGCAALKNIGPDISLTRINCNNKKNVLCLKDNNITGPYEALSWLEAREHCKKNGGDLLTLEKDNPLLESIPSGIFWFGLSRFSLIWHSAGEIVFNKLDYFKDADIGGCVSISKASDFWTIQRCDRKQLPLCFKEKSLPTSATTEITSTEDTFTTTEFTTTTPSDLSTVITSTTMTLDFRYGLVIGCAVSAVVLIVLMTLLICFILHRRQRCSTRVKRQLLSSTAINFRSLPET